jgi:hypothetical protein
MEHGKNWPPEYDHSFNFRDFVVHVYGDTAVMKSDSPYTSRLQIPNSSLKCVQQRPISNKTALGSWLRDNGHRCP